MSDEATSAPCAIESCDRPKVTRGWCRSHYQRWLRNGDPLAGQRARRPRDPECSVEDCDRVVTARGLCGKHYERQKKGHPLQVARLRRSCRELDCTVEGCERRQRTRTFCDPHYKRWLSTGDPQGSKPREPRVNGRGAGWTTPYGYRMLHRPGHPNAGKGNRVPEHVVVMSEILGRGLLPNENVHHRNGQRADNRPENLELWLVPQPAGQRVADLIEFANWITATYGTDAARFQVSGELVYRSMSADNIACTDA